MGIMVSRDHAGELVAAQGWFAHQGKTFDGPRAFAYWATAVAYAMLPASPRMTVAPRRRVRRGSSGRWVVDQTMAPRRK